MLPAKPTPYQILVELFGHEWADNAHLCSFAGDPKDGGNWSGYRVHQRFKEGARVQLPADQNNFFAVGMQSRATTNRANGNVIRDSLVVLDDVGSKVDRDKVEALRLMTGLEPVMVVETSPDNFQYFFRLDDVVERNDFDKQDRLALLELIREALRQGHWGDRAVQDPARYMRLPFGINRKDKYKDKAGAYPTVNLEEWNPGARCSLEDLALAFVGPDWQTQAAAWQPGQRPASASQGNGDRAASMDDVYVRLAEHLGMNPYQLRPGVVAATCPNQAQHTNNDQTGFAFINPYRAHCQHDHCRHLPAEHWLNVMELDYEARILADIVAGRLVDDGEHVKDQAGQIVPRTAAGWMANYECNRVPLTAAELAEAESSSRSYAAVRNSTPDWCRQLNERFCQVLGIDGVLDLTPTEDAAFTILSASHFRRFFDGMQTVPKPAGKGIIGIASAWFEHEKARRYNALGMWEPGAEPANALNIYTGLELDQAKLARNAGVAPFLELVKSLASGRPHVQDYLLNWATWALQNPLKKPGVNLVLFGSQGTGKSVFGRLLMSMFGARYSFYVSTTKGLLGDFNGHLEGKLMCIIDEALFGRDPRVVGPYKALTTEDIMTIEHKGKTIRQVVNRMALLVLSNSLAAIPMEPNDRRSTVVLVGEAKRRDTKFFGELAHWWDNGGREATMDYLLKRDLTGFNVRMCLDLPEKADMATASGDVVTRWWLDRISAGRIPGGGGGNWGEATTILNRDLEADHLAWAREQNQRAATRPELLRRIKELCPSASVTRPGDGRGRERGLAFPELATVEREAHYALGGGTPTA